MTIEEMVRFVEQDLRYAEVDVPYNVPKYKAIIAALRAGQALYEACALDDMDSTSTERIDKAMQAWDAATKGDGG